MNVVTALIALVACGVPAGCGNLTAGGTAQASLVVSGDAPDVQAVAPQRAIGLSPKAPLAMSGGGPEGEVRADFLIFLETVTGASVSLSEDPIQIRLDVQGLQEVDAVDRTTVPAALYTQIRIVFTDVRVEVADGLLINDVPVVGEVRVEIKDASLTVTRPFNLDVGDGESVVLLLDLNANTWLQAVDPVLLTIAEEVFADAVSVGEL